MFHCYEFTFAGESSSAYGLTVSDIGSTRNEDTSFANRANIVETRLPNRVSPLHYGVRYHDDPLEFNLVFSSRKELDRTDVQTIAYWLTGYQDYQWLTVTQDDMEGVSFRCLIRELAPVTDGWSIWGFEAKVICDCPYAYGPQQTVSGEAGSTITINNTSTCRVNIKPDVVITTSGTDFAIQNSALSLDMAFSGMPAGSKTITVKNEDGIITSASNLNPYRYFKHGSGETEHFSDFLELTPGKNTLSVTGNGSCTITWRPLLNVGA